MTIIMICIIIIIIIIIMFITRRSWRGGAAGGEQRRLEAPDAHGQPLFCYVSWFNSLSVLVIMLCLFVCLLFIDLIVS